MLHRAVTLLALLLTAFAHAEPMVSEPSQQPLRVGVTIEYEPVAFEVAGELQGIEVDFARLLAERIGRDIAFEVLPFPELIGALEAGKIDIVMAGMSVTDERAERVAFSEPYMVIGQMGIVRDTDAARFSGPDALNRDGVKVGVHLGSTGEEYVVGNMPRANMIAYPSVEDGLAALRAGDVDVVIHDSTTSWQLRRSFVNDRLLSLNRFLTRESIAWAIRKSDPELRSLVNFALKDMKEEGIVREVINRWLPMIPVNI